MAKARVSYVCSACGATSTRPDGRCLRCGEWGTLEERVEDRTGRVRAVDDAVVPIPITEVATAGQGEVRVRSGIGELDRVLGGGIVAGSAVLLGGDPGVGKSTLLLMAMERFARRGPTVLYATGEESAAQVRLRAERLGVAAPSLLVFAQTDFAAVEDAVQRVRPAVVVVDSVQTLQVGHVDGIPGSVAQVREVAHRAVVLAKRTGTAVILVGHVTKSGDIAGPKLLEHLVDTVLHFEGDGRTSLRVLRSVKNRFGPAGELGLFEMVDDGLVEVPDASARLLAERVSEAAGTAVVACVEGSRPFLTEIQALVGRPSPAIPGRTCVGVDRARVLMLAAVLEKHGVPLHDRDLFVNAAGGVRLFEPAADLAIAAAIASSVKDRPLRADTLVFGEVGLVGEVRAVGFPGPRVREAARHGFRRIVAPASVARDAVPGVELVGVRTLREALQACAG